MSTSTCAQIICAFIIVVVMAAVMMVMMMGIMTAGRMGRLITTSARDTVRLGHNFRFRARVAYIRGKAVTLVGRTASTTTTTTTTTTTSSSITAAIDVSCAITGTRVVAVRAAPDIITAAAAAAAANATTTATGAAMFGTANSTSIIGVYAYTRRHIAAATTAAVVTITATDTWGGCSGRRYHI